ncbi:MAG TPA: 30S ribosomal protein S8 [Ktedonobacteraceae bacterium]
MRGGQGISILSTPQGLMTGRKAYQEGLGGEVVCYVW